MEKGQTMLAQDSNNRNENIYSTKEKTNFVNPEKPHMLAQVGFDGKKNKMKNKNFHSSGGRFNMGAINSISML